MDIKKITSIKWSDRDGEYEWNVEDNRTFYDNLDEAGQMFKDLLITADLDTFKILKVEYDIENVGEREYRDYYLGENE